MNQATRDAHTLIALGRENTRLQEQVTALTADLNQAEQTIEERDAKLSGVQNHHDKIMGEIFGLMPECWSNAEGDQAAVDFVASLLGQGDGMPGHTAGCDCWSG